MSRDEMIRMVQNLITSYTFHQAYARFDESGTEFLIVSGAPEADEWFEIHVRDEPAWAEGDATVAESRRS